MLLRFQFAFLSRYTLYRLKYYKIFDENILSETKKKKKKIILQDMDPGHGLELLYYTCI